MKLKLRQWFWIVLALWIVVCAVVAYRDHQVSEGRQAFDRLGCSGCHMAGGAPSLAQVGRKYDRATLVEFVANPETIYARRGSRPLNAGYEQMPRQQVSPRDVAMLSYFLAAQK